MNLHADFILSKAFLISFMQDVLIYFDQKSKEKVISVIVQHLSPSGLLFVGHSENLGGISPNFKPSRPPYTRRFLRQTTRRERLRTSVASGLTLN